MTQEPTDLIAAVRARLQEQRTEELKRIRTRLHGGGEAGITALQHQSGAGDDAVDDLSNDTDIALLELEVAELRRIDAALQRLDGPLAGTCAGCGEPVPAARLLANPAALTCLACQQREERQPGTHAHHG